jgi:quinoprotein glucose dehydrogenase
MKRQRLNRLLAPIGGLILALIGGLPPLPIARAATAPPASERRVELDWPIYGGSALDDHYSPLKQIDHQNVGQLRPAWRFDMPEPGDTETSPIVIEGTLYAYTPDQKVIALDATNGKLLWKFDAGVRGTGPARGLTYWTDGKDRRLLAGVMNYLYALDPRDGKPIKTFGEAGRVDLRKNLDRKDFDTYDVSLTSPGVIYHDLIIVGFRTGETSPSAPRDIRAYDVRTGGLRWSFHTIPRPGELGHNTWPANAWKTASAANAWAGFALDEKRGIVYIPTGSAASDFYGADRIGDDLFADALLALDAATGKRIWHFQGVHHDLWDRDFSSPPSLLTVTRNGQRIDAIAQPTKQGFLYLFDRANGKPLFLIEEGAYPKSTVPGEVSSPTQPTPTLPEPFARQRLTEQLLTQRTPAAHDWAVKRFHELRSEGQFVPLGLDKPTVIFPGFDGGSEWGGAAVDQQTGVIYINSNDVAWTGMLVKSVPGAGLGASLYQTHCFACHGADRKGSPPAFPSLIEAARRLTPQQIEDVVRSGCGRMPPFSNIETYALKALVHYVITGTDAPQPNAQGRQAPTESKEMVSLFDWKVRSEYAFTGYSKFLDPEGYPAVAPPWGTLNAIDLNTGHFLWKIPLGEYPELAAKGMSATGSENYGGPIVTAGGLVFIAATIYDKKLRAFDSRNGQLLWQTDLPFAGTATPITYMINGKQYIAIETNNSRNKNAAQGAAYMAYALP